MTEFDFDYSMEGDFIKIIAESRLSDNINKDTHNLGKTTFGKLLDFCFLSKLNPGNFLQKNIEFSDFIFYLEIMIEENHFITIRRSVRNFSKVSFKTHKISK